MTNHEPRKQINRLAALLTISFLVLTAANRFGLVALPELRAQSASTSPFSFEEVMIPVRDGVRLQTVILAPADQKGALPILFRRTPYGVPSAAPAQIPPNFKEFLADGYIFVIQNLRGRFKSEGVFTLSSQVDLS